MLLKVGMAMMAFALAFAAITAGVAVGLRDTPEPAIAAKPAANSSLEPLVRSSPPDQTKVGKSEAHPPPEPEPRAGPVRNSQPKPAPPPKPKVQAAPPTESIPQPRPEPRPEPKPEPKPES